MKYKLLVLDVDGTLLNNEKEISKRTLASLLKVQQMGIRIALASGRPTYGLMYVGLPEANATRIPICCTLSKEARVRLLISLASLRSVPSTSRTNNLYFMAAWFWLC